jgi:copper oxidase (laccase) domain-containing protein
MPRGVIANVHSGWRGAVQKIAAEAIDAIGGVGPTAQAWLGPSIRVCCFEVGEEVVDQFRDVYAEAGLFIDRGGAKPHIDLPRLTAALLIQHGIAAQNIHDSGLCTRCDGSIFHSYRRDAGRGGRNLAVAAH